MTDRSEPGVRDRLLGTRSLVLSEVIGSDGAVSYPRGQLRYDGDRVSAQLVQQTGPTEMPGYFGYFGPFTVDAQTAIITHHIQVHTVWRKC